MPDDQLLSFLPLEAVWPGRVDYSRQRPKAEVAAGYTRFLEGDVVVPKITPTFEADRSTLIRGMPTPVGSGTTELHVVRPSRLIEPRYLDYLMSSRSFLLGGEGRMMGVAGQKRVPDQWIRDYPVSVLDVGEQRAIADYLDVETGRIDSLISKKRRLIDLLTERRQALITAAVTGTISLSKPDGITGRSCQVRWSTLPIRRLFRVVNGGTPSADSTNWGGRIAWATPVDVGRSGGTISSTERTLTAAGLLAGSRTVPEGSLLVSSRAPIGYIAETVCVMAFNQGCKSLVPVRPVDIRFFRYQLSVMADELESRGQGSTFLELSGDALAAVPVVNPPPVDQKAIADYLDIETARIDAIISKTQRTIDLLAERRQALITGAVTGELDIPGVAA